MLCAFHNAGGHHVRVVTHHAQVLHSAPALGLRSAGGQRASLPPRSLYVEGGVGVHGTGCMALAVICECCCWWCWLVLLLTFLTLLAFFPAPPPTSPLIWPISAETAADTYRRQQQQQQQQSTGHVVKR